MTTTEAAATELRSLLAGPALPPVLAKLYSQHTLLSNGREGLLSWSQRETEARSRDAIGLAEAAFVLHEAGESGWQTSLRRAAELFEWLSHEAMGHDARQFRLLAAASYQVAGYPARSQSLVDRDGAQTGDSLVIRAFLRNDIAETLRGLRGYWSARIEHEEQLEGPLLLGAVAVDETLGSLGIVCAALRWGDTDRAARALRKLRALGGAFALDPDPHASLLARLIAEVAQSYLDGSLRRHVRPLVVQSSQAGRDAFERYLRISYQSGRVLAWPSQQRGITGLTSQQSVVLCTPTASGKTTVAELAILQGLFAGGDGVASENPIAIYLVPSRALAAEVEAKLARVLRGNPPAAVVLVTGMYGGVDWGPTDAWLSSQERTVLICTYEKGEALIRFLGRSFLDRVRTVVIDEAHNVQFRKADDLDIIQEDRSLRLELLGSRLSALLADRNVRIVALSAVTRGIEEILASWITGDSKSAITEFYRSTRQAVGRLLCRPNGHFEIQLDLLDGSPLRFDSGQGSRQTPFVQDPVPPLPTDSYKASDYDGPEKRLRPYFFWAGVHLAASAQGRKSSVLLFVPAYMEAHAGDLLSLLESWDGILPPYFEPPTGGESKALWEDALAAIDDYFGSDSYQSRLLRKGILMHHGSMPGRLGRMLSDLVDAGVINLVLATSTLSEGVNLPFGTVLIPSLFRGGQPIPKAEIANLIGRAGRPGTATEGRGLVLLYDTPGFDRPAWRAKQQYRETAQALVPVGSDGEGTELARSPLAVLLELIEREWQGASGSQDRSAFLSWLESTVPTELLVQDKEEVAVTALDTLDSFLLAAIEEAERLSDLHDLASIESRLSSVWQRTYARYATANEERLRETLTVRGRSLVSHVYPQRATRRRFYDLGLPPRSGSELLAVYEQVRAHFETGFHYAEWDDDSKFSYVETTIDILRSVPAFALPPHVPGGKRNHWSSVLRWWLDPEGAKHRPASGDSGRWLEYVNRAFTYRFNWSLGSIVALVVGDLNIDGQVSFGLEQWPPTGLPWAAFWLTGC